jgi:putative aldouronate transport system permease protein
MTIIATVSQLLITSAAAYALTKKDLMFKKVIISIFLIPMFIGGGLIPYYLLIRTLGLINNFLVFILPGLFNFYYAIIMRVYFQSNIPESLYESAYLDGANDLYIYFKLVLPLSKPMLAAVALFIGVGAWNDWMTPMLYCNNAHNLWTLQFILQKMVTQAQAMIQLITRSRHAVNQQAIDNMITPQTITYATLIVATLPILLIYPFLQKYFVSGIMIGSVKG